MALTIINLTQNDDGVVFEFNLKDKSVDGDFPVSLIGATVYFNIRKGKAAPIKGLCTIVDPEEGKCEYKFKPGDLDIGGHYRGEVEVFYPDGANITSQQVIEFFVRKEIA